jgi:hypothetical protein
VLICPRYRKVCFSILVVLMFSNHLFPCLERLFGCLTEWADMISASIIPLHSSLWEPLQVRLRCVINEPMHHQVGLIENYMHFFPGAATTNQHKMGNLKQQKFVLPQVLGARKVKIKVSQGHMPPRGCHLEFVLCLPLCWPSLICGHITPIFPPSSQALLSCVSYKTLYHCETFLWRVCVCACACVCVCVCVCQAERKTSI